MRLNDGGSGGFMFCRWAQVVRRRKMFVKTAKLESFYQQGVRSLSSKWSSLQAADGYHRLCDAAIVM